MKCKKHIASLSTTLFINILMTACSGSSAPPLTNVTGQIENTDGSIQNDDSMTSPELFPPEGPIVDPESTREEIALRADKLLAEYRLFMSELLPQMNEVYQTISSGLPSSTDPEVLATDVKFVNTINKDCDLQFDSNGAMTGLFNCDNIGAQFALRHPRYSNVQVLVNDFSPTANFDRGDETGIYIASGEYVPLNNYFAKDEVVRITTGKFPVSTDESLNIPMILLIHPEFTINRELCMIYLSPTRLPDDSLELNRCSEMYKDTITVLERLNRRE